jgi:hypothetical protein
MKSEPDCYGKMFPPLISLAHNEPVTGKVFGYQIDRPGMAVTKRFVTTNLDAWRHCLECADLDGCYRLSTGTVLMEIALKP